MCIHTLQQFLLINLSLNTQFTFVHSTQLLPKFTAQHAFWRLLHQRILICDYIYKTPNSLPISKAKSLIQHMFKQQRKRKYHCPLKLYQLRRMSIHTQLELGSGSCCTSLPCSCKIQPNSKMCINQRSIKKRFSHKLTEGAPTAVAVTQCMTHPHTCNTNDHHILTSDSLLEIK